MRRGEILAAVRKDSRSSLIAALVFLAVISGVLGLNWKYMYNFLTGPFAFDARLAAAPGPREFVRAEGPLLPTGIVQESTLRLLRGAIESKSVSASYLAMFSGGKFLIVKVPPEFSGKTVEGRLVPLPESVRTALVDNSKASLEHAFHPFLLEQLSYRLDANLFVMIATPLLPLSLIFLAFASWQALRAEHHAALRRLAKHGPIHSLLPSIEGAFANPRETRVGPLWLTSEWLFCPGPTLLLYNAKDLAGIGLAATREKSGAVTHALKLWSRDELLPAKLEVSAREGLAVMAAVARRMPWALVEDAAGMERRWKDDRKACLREADERRGGAGTTHA
jgi:hypothetical protein